MRNVAVYGLRMLRDIRNANRFRTVFVHQGRGRPQLNFVLNGSQSDGVTEDATRGVLRQARTA